MVGVCVAELIVRCRRLNTATTVGRNLRALHYKKKAILPDGQDGTNREESDVHNNRRDVMCTLKQECRGERIYLWEQVETPNEKMYFVLRRRQDQSQPSSCFIPGTQQ